MVYLLCVVGVVVVVAVAGRLLVSVDQARVADAIIVLSGAGGRLEKGIGLFHEGYGGHLILSNSGDFDEGVLVESGVPVERVIMESGAVSTYTNATLTREIVLDRGFRSVVVVTSEFHTSRSKYIFNRVYRDTGVVLSVVGSRSGFARAGVWWFSFKGVYVMAVECVKWVYYLGRY